MTIITIPKANAETYTNAKLGLNIEQFTKGIPEPVTSVYSVMELSDILTRMTSGRTDATIQGLVNSFAALFNTTLYRANETRGVVIQYPADRFFRLKKFNPAVPGTHLVGTHLYNFDSNGNFVVPAVPLIPSGAYGDTTFIYGQPDKRITNETVKFSMYMDGDTTKSIDYTLNTVPGKEDPTLDQIAIYSLNDPETVRDIFLRLPESAQIYDHIMSAGGYGFTWGRFKWDTHRWDNPKPGGLYPSKFDSVSAEIEATAGLPTKHHNGVLNVYKDLVIQDTLSAEDSIQVTAGYLLWGGIKIYLAGYCNFLPDTSVDPVNLADAVTAAADDDYTETLVIDPGTRNLMAPTTVITDTPLSLYTDDSAALPVETVLAAATAGTSPWTFVAVEQLYPSLTYGVEKYSALDSIIDNGLGATVTITIATNTVNVTTGMTKPVAGEYIKVYAESHAVNSGLSLDAALAGGYYPIFQHPWKLQGLNSVIDFDPNALDFIAPDGTSLSRVVLPKQIEEVEDPGSLLDSYLDDLNTEMASWPLGSYDPDTGATAGKLCYTETEDEDGIVTLKLRHSELESYSADEVTWVYDQKEDGLLSTGIPKDSQKYDLGHTILSFEDVGTLATAVVEASSPVSAATQVITLVIKPIDSRGNRMSGVDFKVSGITGVDTTAVHHSRLDGLLFIPLTVQAFTSGKQTIAPVLTHYVGDDIQTAITLSIALYEA